MLQPLTVQGWLDDMGGGMEVTDRKKKGERRRKQTVVGSKWLAPPGGGGEVVVVYKATGSLSASQSPIFWSFYFLSFFLSFFSVTDLGDLRCPSEL